MYDNPCNYCEYLERCKSMINMPNMKMPMNNMPIVLEDDNEDLKMLYPKIHKRIYPMVAYHCDMIEAGHGTMYCPSKIEMDNICDEICDRYEKDCRYNFDDDNLDNYNDMTRRRRRRPSRRNTIQDLIKILLIGELIGRRRGLPIYYG